MIFPIKIYTFLIVIGANMYSISIGSIISHIKRHRQQLEYAAMLLS